MSRRRRPAAATNICVRNRPSAIFYFLALAGLVIAVSATKLVDFDIWWHLKTGELIALWKLIPRQDIFSYTAFGAPWTNHEWLFELLCWSLWNKFGLPALIFMKVALTAAIVYFVFRAGKLLSGSSGASLFGCVVLLAAMADRIMERPHMFSLLFAAFYFLQLNRFVANKRSYIFALPLLQVVWTNLHGEAILGPLIVFAFALGETAQTVFDRRFGCEEVVCIEEGRIIRIWLVAALCLGGCLINPYGLNAIVFSASHLRMDAITSFTQEWLQPLDPRLDAVISQIVFRFFFVVLIVSYLLNRRAARFSHIALTVLTSILVLKGRRFTPEFMVMNIPVALFNFGGVLKSSNIRETVRLALAWSSVASVTLISVLALRYGVPLSLNGWRTDEMGIGIQRQAAPSELVNFLEENKISGRVFNEMGLGGYLIFKRWPRERVFIDGRTPVYGNDFYKSFVEAFYLPQNFEELNKRYDFEYLVFKGDLAWGLRHFHKYLWRHPDWRLVYFNPQEGLVYVKNITKFRNVIKRHSLKKFSIVDTWDGK